MRSKIVGKRLTREDPYRVSGRASQTGEDALQFTLSDAQVAALAEIVKLESASAVRIRVPTDHGDAPRKAVGVEAECWAPGSGWTEPYAVRPATGAFASDACDWWRVPPREDRDEVAATHQGLARQERSARAGDLREDAPAA